MAAAATAAGDGPSPCSAWLVPQCLWNGCGCAGTPVTAAVVGVAGSVVVAVAGAGWERLKHRRQPALRCERRPRRGCWGWAEAGGVAREQTPWWGLGRGCWHQSRPRGWWPLPAVGRCVHLA